MPDVFTIAIAVSLLVQIPPAAKSDSVVVAPSQKEVVPVMLSGAVKTLIANLVDAVPQALVMVYFTVSIPTA